MPRKFKKLQKNEPTGLDNFDKAGNKLQKLIEMEIEENQPVNDLIERDEQIKEKKENWLQKLVKGLSFIF